MLYVLSCMSNLLNETTELTVGPRGKSLGRTIKLRFLELYSHMEPGFPHLLPKSVIAIVNNITLQQYNALS